MGMVRWCVCARARDRERGTSTHQLLMMRHTPLRALCERTVFLQYHALYGFFEVVKLFLLLIDIGVGLSLDWMSLHLWLRKK